MTILDPIPEKAQIIAAAAIDAIHERGLDRFKLTDVARKAGVTTGAVTYYFEDKDALLLAAFDETWRRMFEEINAFEGGWQLERFTRTLPLTPQRQKGWSVWLAFCGRAQTSEAINDHYRAAYVHLEDLLFEAAHHAGDTPSRHDIRTVIAAMDGIGLCATLHPELWSPDRQRATLTAMTGHMFS